MPLRFIPSITLPRLPGTPFDVALHELNRQHVQTKGPAIRPFHLPQGFQNGSHGPTPKGSFTVTPWSLFHATKKAELLRDQSPIRVRLRTLGLFLEYYDLFAARSGEIRITPGQTNLYGDFSKTSLAGRIAQGMTFLFMDRRGYRSGERLESFVRRLQGMPGTSPHWGVTVQALLNQQAAGRRAPDFIFQDHQSYTALVESKGGFAAPNSQPPIKQSLREGLEQIAQWLPVSSPSPINPAPNKAFVVGTYLREEGDTSAEPSGIVFVDPKGAVSNDDIPRWPRDIIDRANYAAWLMALGFFGAASALRDYQESNTREQLPLPCVQMSGQTFAFTVWAADPEMSDVGSHWWSTGNSVLDTWRLFERLQDPPRVVLCGIEVGVLSAISRVLQPGASREPLVIDGPVVREPLALERRSIFSDGTMLGEFNVDELRALQPEIRGFSL